MRNMHVINTNKKTDSFGAKANLLNLGIKDQIDMLNTMYDDKIRFGMSPNQKIAITAIDKSVICIALPETDNLDTDCLFQGIDFIWYGKLVSTVKLPKAFKELDLSSRWVHYVDRLFMWDTTEIVGDQIPDNIQLLVMQKESGGKPRY